MRLETERTILRAFQLSDFENLKVMMTDIEVVKTTGFRIVQTDEQIVKKLSEWVIDSQIWCIAGGKSNDCIGWVMLKLSEDTTPELGYMINRSFWKQGFATEVSNRLLKYGFEVLGYERVIAKCDSNNHSSIRVLKKLGMKQLSTSNELLIFEKS